MQNKSARFLPVLFIFFIINILVWLAKPMWAKYGVDAVVLAGANLLFFLTGMVVFFIQKKALANPNPNVFVRSVIAGTMIKMFTCMLAVLAYVLLAGPLYNKKSVFIALFIYLFYLAAEVAAIIKLNKKMNG